MMKKKRTVYNPEIELAKGATLDAASYDKTQKIKVTAGKVTVGGIPSRAEISGIATGRSDASINGYPWRVSLHLPLYALGGKSIETPIFVS